MSKIEMECTISYSVRCDGLPVEKDRRVCVQYFGPHSESNGIYRESKLASSWCEYKVYELEDFKKALLKHGWRFYGDDFAICTECLKRAHDDAYNEDDKIYFSYKRELKFNAMLGEV